MTMAAVLAEKIVSQLSISFPEAAIPASLTLPYPLYKSSGGSRDEILYTAVCCPTPDRPDIIQK